MPPFTLNALRSFATEIQICVSTKKQYEKEISEHKKEKKKEKSAAAIQRIEEVIGFENLLSYIRPTDLIQCCRYPNLGNAIAIKIIDTFQ